MLRGIKEALKCSVQCGPGRVTLRVMDGRCLAIKILIIFQFELELIERELEYRFLFPVPHSTFPCDQSGESDN